MSITVWVDFAFLLASLRHFLANQRDRDRAKKRGGGRCPLSLDLAHAEGRFAQEPIDDLTPERAFERQWALELLSRVLENLRAEMAAAGKGDQFAALKPLLMADADAPPYAQVAERLGANVGALRVTVHRLRRRYRDLLHQEVAQTVADPADIDAELRELVAALR